VSSKTGQSQGLILLREKRVNTVVHVGTLIGRACLWEKESSYPYQRLTENRERGQTAGSFQEEQMIGTQRKDKVRVGLAGRGSTGKHGTR